MRKLADFLSWHIVGARTVGAGIAAAVIGLVSCGKPIFDAPKALNLQDCSRIKDQMPPQVQIESTCLDAKVGIFKTGKMSEWRNGGVKVKGHDYNYYSGEKGTLELVSGASDVRAAEFTCTNQGGSNRALFSWTVTFPRAASANEIGSQYVVDRAFECSVSEAQLSTVLDCAAVQKFTTDPSADKNQIPWTKVAPESPASVPVCRMKLSR